MIKVDIPYLDKYVENLRDGAGEAHFMVESASDAYRGELDAEELDRYLDGLSKIPLVAGLGAGLGSAALGSEMGLYELENAIEGYRGLEEWTEPLNSDGSLVMAGTSFGGAAVGAYAAWKGVEWLGNELVERNHGGGED